MMVLQHRCVEHDFCSDSKVSWYLIQVILPRELRQARDLTRDFQGSTYLRYSSDCQDIYGGYDSPSPTIE